MRLATLRYTASTKSTSTNVSTHCDMLAHSEGQAHLLSVFGNDAEVGAIAAALSVGASFTIAFPDGSTTAIGMESPTVFRGAIQIPGRTRPVRHLVALSKTVVRNGDEGKVFAISSEASFLWSTTVSFMGLPATPEWAVAGVRMMAERGYISELKGFNCSPVLVTLPREELLEWLGEQVKSGVLPFPDHNGPVAWGRHDAASLLFGEGVEPLQKASGF